MDLPRSPDVSQPKELQPWQVIINQRLVDIFEMVRKGTTCPQQELNELHRIGVMLEDKGRSIVGEALHRERITTDMRATWRM